MGVEVISNDGDALITGTGEAFNTTSASAIVRCAFRGLGPISVSGSAVTATPGSTFAEGH